MAPEGEPAVTVAVSELSRRTIGLFALLAKSIDIRPLTVGQDGKLWLAEAVFFEGQRGAVTVIFGDQLWSTADEAVEKTRRAIDELKGVISSVIATHRACDRKGWRMRPLRKRDGADAKDRNDEAKHMMICRNCRARFTRSQCAELGFHVKE